MKGVLEVEDPSEHRIEDEETGDASQNCYDPARFRLAAGVAHHHIVRPAGHASAEHQSN